MTTTTVKVNPYNNLTQQARWLRRDTINGKIPVGQVIKSADFANKQGTFTELVWRPPLQYQSTTGGDTKFDQRGQFCGFRHVKVKFRNLLDVPVDVYVNTPLAALGHDNDVITRINHMKVTLDPSGSKKDMQRGKGKQAKAYSKRTDTYVHFFSTRDFLRGDTNFETILKNQITTRDDTGPDYRYTGWTMADYCIVLNDLNKNTGVVYPPDMDCIDVIYEVKYEVCALEGGENVNQTVKTNALTLLTGDVSDMFEFASQAVQTGFAVVQDVRMNPLLTTLPDQGYNEVGIHKVDRGSWWFEFQLYWLTNGEPAVPVTLRNYEDSNIRIVIPAFNLMKFARDTGYSGGWCGAEWGYSESAHAWILMKPDGTAAWVKGAQNGFDEYPMVGTTPVVVYSRRRPTRSSIEARQLRLSVAQVIGVISTVIKVLEFATTILAAL